LCSLKGGSFCCAFLPVLKAASTTKIYVSSCTLRYTLTTSRHCCFVPRIRGFQWPANPFHSGNRTLSKRLRTKRCACGNFPLVSDGEFSLLHHRREQSEASLTNSDTTGSTLCSCL
jgi:hypothetical protein